ncbi:heme exporter protein CcmA [Steroidobacter denitrificans]|uniref:Heme exporter protein CcmA n=1 Tax=Steroidobacter denitrificans TaxID=465721 RepID=A0A127FBU3_STEDE|nr:cytochrome c biogenesis heme-transporting ATPase CcmA [Steroidobacter denitrificans]AMN47039.1 heme exporter protein CcmA [Steroidobacter denitrificans]
MPEPLAAIGAQPLLEACAVHLWRGERHLLRGVTFTLAGGELLQVVGPNGVGKTSLLRCIAGLLPRESGDIFWGGQSIDRCRDEFHRQLAYLAHANAIKSELTTLENLHYGTVIKGRRPHAELLDMLQRLGIGACAELPARVLSAGQKRRVALARILLLRATLWILDEPITNLDAAGVSLVERCMDEHLRSGGMIIAAAHQRLLQGHPGTRALELH